MIKLSFPVTPKACQSFRFTKTGRRYQPKEVLQFKRLISQIASCQYNGEPLKGPIGIYAVFNFKYLKSFSKKKIEYLESGGAIHKTTKPDLTDNLMKGFIDALAGIVFEQDQQICVVHSRKVYALEDGIELTAFEIKQ